MNQVELLELSKRLQLLAELNSYALRIAVVSGIKPSVVKEHIKDLTPFEMNLICRAFGIGAFNVAQLNINLEYVIIHFLKNGKNIYDKQVKTAERVYNLLKEIKGSQ